MSFSTPITEQLLFAYFSGRATAVQKQLIEKWMTDPANEEFFFAALHKWENENAQFTVDVNQAIQRFQLDLATGKSSSDSRFASQVEQSVQGAGRSNWKTYLVAASLLFILGINAWLFRDTIFYKSFSTTYGEISFLTLSDGSQVTLNANSTLKVPRFGFDKPARNVFLQGEACFSIVHTPDHQRFVVQTDPLFQVEVLGTKFSVFARPRQTKVMLIQGKVKVQYNQNKPMASALTMAPGDLVTLNPQAERLQVQRVPEPENMIAWMQHRFVFNNTSVLEIKNILTENYGLTVALAGDRLADQTISGSFKAQTADELLAGISAVLDIHVNRQNDHVTLISNNHPSTQ
jgi:transmembrane sensor